MHPEVIFLEASGAATRLLPKPAAYAFLQQAATRSGVALTTHAADHLEPSAKVHDIQLALPPRDPSVPTLPPATASVPSKGARAGAVPSLLQASSYRPVPPTIRVFLPTILAHAE